MEGVQQQIQHHIAEVDKYLSEIDSLNVFEKQFQQLAQKPQVKKAHILLGLIAFIFFLVLLNVWAAGFTTFVGFLYPAYWSIRALQTRDSKDDSQWLTYWVVFSFLIVIENAMGDWMEGVPLYYPAKFILIVWLMYPGTRGAEFVFHNVIKAIPFLHFEEKSFSKGFSDALSKPVSEGMDAVRNASQSAEDAARKLVDSEED
mmetsp:Transcript_10558/g.29599  ORF Transcript_10558/g.29599 Transcript_10558/m.29599 type:complete len:202 (+) Transcript_10558:118-723(+)